MRGLHKHPSVAGNKRKLGVIHRGYKVLRMMTINFSFTNCRIFLFNPGAFGIDGVVTDNNVAEPRVEERSLQCRASMPFR